MYLLNNKFNFNYCCRITIVLLFKKYKRSNKATKRICLYLGPHLNIN